MSKVNQLRVTLVPEGGDWRWMINEPVNDPVTEVFLIPL